MNHFIFWAEVSAKSFENLSAMPDEIAILKDAGVNHTLICQMVEHVLERFVEFSHENLGLVMTNTEFLLYKSDGIFKVGSHSSLEINVCLCCLR